MLWTRKAWKRVPESLWYPCKTLILSPPGDLFQVASWCASRRTQESTLVLFIFYRCTFYFINSCLEPSPKTPSPAHFTGDGVGVRTLAHGYDVPRLSSHGACQWDSGSSTFVVCWTHCTYQAHSNDGISTYLSFCRAPSLHLSIHQTRRSPDPEPGRSFEAESVFLSLIVA